MVEISLKSKAQPNTDTILYLCNKDLDSIESIILNELLDDS